jgi:cytosine/adenosine deaminase-related metal-dependent hydrolase
MALVVQGTVVTMDGSGGAAGRVLDDGAVWVGDDGRIAAVTAAGDAEPAGFDDATRVRTGGVVYPGLVDLHSHVMYNALPLWQQPNRDAPFKNHNQWPGASTYGRDVSQPGRLLGLAAGRALLAYVEAKAIVGGTTSIQGNPKGSRPPEGQLVRNVDTEALGTKEDFIKVTTIVADDLDGLVSAAAALANEKGFIYHLCEGTDDSMADEFELAKSAGLFGPRFVGIHGTGLSTAQLGHWAGKGGTMVWSPFSNYWLYGATARVADAKAAGLRLCLGSDWSPSGTKNLLAELKVADLWNQAQPDPLFSDEELCALVTANPGEALEASWGVPVGRLVAGALADLVVLGDREADPHRNLVEATERDVQLVLVGGRPRYGTATLMKRAGAGTTSTVRLGRISRRIDLGVDGLTWKDVLDELETVRADPVEAKRRVDEALAAVGGDLDDPAAPFVLLPDMPSGTDDADTALGAGGAATVPIVVPPLERLHHTQAWFDTVDTNPFHEGLLSGLRRYYS